MLQKLEKEITREYAGYMDNAKRFIKNGHEYDKEAGIREYLTVGKWAKYEAGEITRTEAVKKACERMAKQYGKKADKELVHVRTCETAEIPNFISIRVEWKRSTVWGSNPTAEVITGTYTTGTASGCGYDKESAAVAKALNKQFGLLRLMYEAKNKHPRTNNHKLLGYGSGYGARPYFEGGVGMTSLIHVLESIGYRKTSEHHGRMCDFYDFERI